MAFGGNRPGWLVGRGSVDRSSISNFAAMSFPVSGVSKFLIYSNFQDYKWGFGNDVRFSGGLCGILYLLRLEHFTGRGGSADLSAARTLTAEHAESAEVQEILLLGALGGLGGSSLFFDLITKATRPSALSQAQD